MMLGRSRDDQVGLGECMSRLAAVLDQESRRLNCVDQCLPAIASLEPAEFLRGDHDDSVASVYRDVLRSLAANPPHLFAEARFRILQKPLILIEKYLELQWWLRRHRCRIAAENALVLIRKVRPRRLNSGRRLLGMHASGGNYE